jgi:phage-related minor tail protein
MTFEEIQQAIEGMLIVQRELQNSQLKLTERAMKFDEEMEALKSRQEAFTSSLETLTSNQEAFTSSLETSQANFDRRFEQLIGYSINRECDSLDIQQDILDLRHRVVALERKLSES